MKRILVLTGFLTAVLLAAYGAITWYDDNLQIGRMWETPGVKPHEQPLLVMEPGSVPAAGGEGLWRALDGEKLAPPLDMDAEAVIESGRLGYRTFCAQCHGSAHDGQGPVGQSFAPLPGDLRGAKVQSLAAGTIFKEISFGIPGGRQPALATTISPEGRWQITAYVKSLGPR